MAVPARRFRATFADTAKSRSIQHAQRIAEEHTELSLVRLGPMFIACALFLGACGDGDVPAETRAGALEPAATSTAHITPSESTSSQGAPSDMASNLDALISDLAMLQGTDNIDVRAAADRLMPSERWEAIDEPQVQNTTGTPGSPIGDSTGPHEDWCRALDARTPQPPLSVFAEFQTEDFVDVPYSYLFIDIHQFDEIEHADRYVEVLAVELADCSGIDLLIEPSGASGSFTVEALPLGSAIAKRNVYPQSGSISARIPAGHVVIDVRVKEVTAGNLDLAIQELTAAAELAALAILAERN